MEQEIKDGRVITSTTNDKVKLARFLQTRKGRNAHGQFLLEGPKIVKEAINNGVRILSFYILQELEMQYRDIIKTAEDQNITVFWVNEAVLSSMSDTKTPQDLIAIAQIPEALSDENLLPGLYVVLDEIQDPGNLGAVLRSADAFGVQGILLGEGCADPYAPKTIRSAMGSTFHVSIFQTTFLAKSLKSWKDQGIYLLATDLHGQSGLSHIQSDKVALLIGNEGNGLHQEILDLSDSRYCLSMKGKAESLNASVCTGIMLYELSKLF